MNWIDKFPGLSQLEDLPPFRLHRLFPPHLRPVHGDRGVGFSPRRYPLAQKLLDLVGDGNTLQATHQQLATELGTAREVVSRLLQDFQQRGWVSLSRGSVELTEKAGLRGLSEVD